MLTIERESPFQPLQCSIPNNNPLNIAQFLKKKYTLIFISYIIKYYTFYEPCISVCHIHILERRTTCASSCLNLEGRGQKEIDYRPV